MFNKEEKKVADEISNSSNIIGKGTVLEGSLETYGNIRVEGKKLGQKKIIFCQKHFDENKSWFGKRVQYILF